MTVATPPTMTAAPTSPDRADRATFTARSIALDNWRKNYNVPESQAIAANCYANAVDAATSATSAATQAGAAAGSATAAAASATAAGAILWVSGTTYAINDTRNSTVNFFTYRRKTVGAGTIDPSLDATNWVLVGVSGQFGTIPVNGLIPLPTTSADLVTGQTGEKYMRTGVVDDAATYPLAMAETAPYVPTTQSASWQNSGTAGSGLCYGLGVFVRSLLATPLSWSTDGITWINSGFSTSGTSQSVAFDVVQNCFYCVTGDGASIWTYISFDGKTWVQRYSPVSLANVVYGVCANNGILVCQTSTNSTVVTSTDGGLTWVACGTSFSASCLASGATYNATIGLFLVTGANQLTSATSSNGTTWTQRTLAFTPGSQPQASSAGAKFWSASATQLYSSTDGIGWSPITVAGFSANNGTGRFGIALVGTTYVLASDTGAWTSPDGTTWTARTSPFRQTGASPFHIASSGSLVLLSQYMSGGYLGNAAFTADGITWTLYGADTSYNIGTTFPYVTGDGAGKFLGVFGGYSAGTKALKSTDGKTWLSNNGLTLTGDWRPYILNGLYIAVDAQAASTKIMSSTDSVTWSTGTIGSAGASNWYTCGAYGSSFYLLMPGGSSASAIAATSAAGSTWAAQTVPSLNYTGVAYGAGKFVAVSTTAGTAYCTGAPTGTWTAGTCMVASGIVFVGSKFFVWSNVLIANKTSTDGITWAFNRNPADLTISDCQMGGDGKAYIVNPNGTYSSVDGTTWVFVCLPTNIVSPKLVPTATGIMHVYVDASGIRPEYKRHVRVANSVAQYPVKATGGTASTTHQMYMRVA